MALVHFYTLELQCNHAATAPTAEVRHRFAFSEASYCVRGQSVCSIISNTETGIAPVIFPGVSFVSLHSSGFTLSSFHICYLAILEATLLPI